MCLHVYAQTHTHSWEPGCKATSSSTAGPGWVARVAGQEQGLTFLQSLQNTDEPPRKPGTSPQSRHWERPFPITLRLMVSSRSTSRLQHRTQSQMECASCAQPDHCWDTATTRPPATPSPTCCSLTPGTVPCLTSFPGGNS